MRTRGFATLALVGLLAALPAVAVEPAPVTAVASGGAFYKLHAGRFADLFGAATELPADRAVLALDIVPPGEALQRWVVPGTEGVEVESEPALIFDDSTSTLHLVWSSRSELNLVTSRLLLRSLGPAGWSEPIDLSGGTISEKRALRLALTADRYRTEVAGVEKEVTRRVLHLVWVESVPDLGARTFYSPIVFVDGRYIGWNPVLRPDELVDAETPSPVPAAAALRESPALETGRGGDRVAIGFVDPATLRVATVEVRPLPGELGQLAEEARGHIIEYGLTHFPSDMPGLASDARGHIIEYATAFHPAVASFVADGTSAYLLSADPSLGLDAVAAGARSTVLTLGDQVSGGGLANGCAGEGSLLELPPLVPEEGADFPHFFALRAVKFWGAPEVAAEPPTLMIAPDGRNALVGWIAGARLLYRETLPDESGFWSELRSLDLSQVPFSDAFAALEARLAGR